jgi:predicted Fe-Mo cluster-binding NifX family protein
LKLCFPVKKYDGLHSYVYGHFGSAPGFALFDTDTEEITEITNQDADHEHGKCSPLRALSGLSIDSVIVGGIGAGALNKLIEMGASVYKAENGSIKDNLFLFREGRLNQFNPSLVCGGHGKGSGCSHH